MYIGSINYDDQYGNIHMFLFGRNCSKHSFSIINGNEKNMIVTSEFLWVLSAFLLQSISETFRVQDNLLICRNTFNWFSMSKVDWFLLTSPYSFASYTFNKYIALTRITLPV